MNIYVEIETADKDAAFKRAAAYVMAVKKLNEENEAEKEDKKS